MSYSRVHRGYGHDKKGELEISINYRDENGWLPAERCTEAIALDTREKLPEEERDRALRQREGKKSMNTKTGIIGC